MKFLTLLFLVFSNCEGIDSTNETAYFAFRRVKLLLFLINDLNFYEIEY